MALRKIIDLRAIKAFGISATHLTMSTKAIKLVKDEILKAAKRKSQQRSHELVRSGVRSQESMSWLSAEKAKKLKIVHRWTDFD